MLMIGSVGGALHAQGIPGEDGERSGIRVALDWHTVAEPEYGAGYQYTWNNIDLRTKDGAEIPTDPGFEISKDEGGGVFTMLSKPIVVPSRGTSLHFDRLVTMQPSVAEQGTALPNAPNDKCRNHALGVTRAVFHQVIDILDAESGKVLAYHVDEYKFDISRRQILNGISTNKSVTIDLSQFADRAIKIRVWILAGYNGRGPATSTAPRITSLHPTTSQDLK